MLYLRDKNLEISLAVLYLTVNIKSFIEKSEAKVSKYYQTREKKAVFLLISDNISLEGELINVADVDVNFYQNSNSKIMPFMNPRMVLIGSLVIIKINKNIYFYF